jgi:hypothetical protein
MRVLGPGVVELRVLPTLTLEELFERYKIAGPIDETRDRAAWQEAAARQERTRFRRAGSHRSRSASHCVVYADASVGRFG